MVRGVLPVGLIPLKHVWRVVDVGPPTKLLNNLFRVVKHVVSVNDGEMIAVDDAFPEQEVKEADKLLVTGLTGHEVVKASNFAQGRDSATPVRGDGSARMADEESEVELAQGVQRQRRRVAGLRVAAVAADRWRNEGIFGVGGH